jgi:hypothetical protein
MVIWVIPPFNRFYTIPEPIQIESRLSLWNIAPPMPNESSCFVNNGRESELIDRTEENGSKRQIFVCSEFVQQVTFGTGSQVGVPRQVGTNYAHFWTWKETPGNANADKLTGNLLTAAYLDPQDSLFFDEPSKPVAVYSHLITANRIG